MYIYNENIAVINFRYAVNHIILLVISAITMLVSKLYPKSEDNYGVSLSNNPESKLYD